MSQSVQSQLASDAVVKMLKQSFTCLLLLYVYILEGSARPENSPSQDTNRVKRSVIYDQNNDWDSIMLKGKACREGTSEKASGQLYIGK